MGKLISALRNPRAVATALIGLGAVLTYGLGFPGSMEFDSYVQLVEGRYNFYTNWHPAVMSWLLGSFDTLPGSAEAWFTALTVLLGFSSLAAVVWLARRVSWAAVFVAGAFLVLPQLLLMQVIVWKDTLFADAVLAGFVVLGFAGRYWTRTRLRLGLIAAAAVLFALVMLARQNGVIVVPFAAAVVVAMARLKGEAWRPALVSGTGLIGCAAILALCSNAALQLRADDYPGRQEQIKVLHLYDITGMVRADPTIALPVLEHNKPVLAALIRSRGVALWSPVKNDTLEIAPITKELEEADPASLRDQWRDLILAHPMTYLAVRAELLRWVIQPPDVGLCHPFHVGSDGDPADLAELGISQRLDARDIALKHYGEAFQRYTPVFSHLLYMLIAAAAFVLLLLRRHAEDVALAGLIAAAFGFTATFAVISIACDYRYLYLVDLTALWSLLYIAADWQSFWTFVQKKRGP